MHYRQMQWVRLLGVAALLLVAGSAIYAQKDPGVRQAPGAGAPLKGLSPIELSMFSERLSRVLRRLQRHNPRLTYRPSNGKPRHPNQLLRPGCAL
jgi:hypothetical protein